MPSLHAMTLPCNRQLAADVNCLCANGPCKPCTWLVFAMHLTGPFVVPAIYRHAHRNLTGASFSCREYHLCVAVSSKNTKLHCPLSSLAGGGVCAKCMTSVLFLSLSLWRFLPVSRLRTNHPPQPHSPSPCTAGHTIPYHTIPCRAVPYHASKVIQSYFINVRFVLTSSRFVFLCGFLIAFQNMAYDKYLYTRAGFFVLIWFSVLCSLYSPYQLHQKRKPLRHPLPHRWRR